MDPVLSEDAFEAFPALEEVDCFGSLHQSIICMLEVLCGSIGWMDGRVLCPVFLHY